MKLGAFSLSLNVKDIEISKEFYEALGFHIFQGDITKQWLIMRNGHCTIGLFQDMFDGNILTFNPGWDEEANTLDSYTDIREIQGMLKEKGIDISEEVEKDTTGPAHFMIHDPDGNTILFDQHI